MAILQIVENFSKIILIALNKTKMILIIMMSFAVVMSKERNALHAEATSLIILSKKKLHCLRRWIVIYSLWSQSTSLITGSRMRNDVHARCEWEQMENIFHSIFPSIVQR